MDKIDNAVMVNITAFLERLKAAGMQIAGSHLTSKADEWSDIDLTVISPQIGSDRFEERVRLTKIALAIDDRIEPLPFSPDSFTPDNPLVREILRPGLRVWSSTRQPSHRKFLQAIEKGINRPKVQRTRQRQ